MAGIYIHIPFCKQSCSYCDFHFSTSLKHKKDLIQGLLKEIEQRKHLLTGKINTIYFGGGTPSILEEDDLLVVVDQLYKNYDIRTIDLKYAGATEEAKHKERKEYLIINYKPANQVGLF